jgi:nucleoid-associated protein YgaU
MALRSSRFRLRCLFAFAILGGSLAARAALPAQVVAELRSKAESGNAIAQYNLGLAYADPSEPIADPSEAFVWLTLAQEKGSNERALQALLERLTPAQLAEGRRRLEARRTTLAQAAAVRESSPITPVSTVPSGPVAVVTPTVAAGLPPAVAAATPAELAALQEEKRQLSAELAAAWRETEAAKAGSISKVAELNLLIAARDRTIAELQQRLATSSAPGAPATKPEDLRLAESARDQAQRELLAAAAEIRAANEALAGERAAAADVRRRVDALASEKAEAERRIVALQAELARQPGAAAEVLRLQATVAARETEIAGLRQEVAQRSQAAEELQRRVASAPVADDSSARLLAETEAKLSAALRSFSLQRDALDAAQASLNDLQAERAALTARVDVLKTESEALAGEVGRLRTVAAETEVRLQDHSQTKGELDTARAALARLEPAASEVIVLREQLRHAQQQNGSLALEIGQLRTRIAALAPAPGSLLSPPSRPGASPATSLAAPPPAPVASVALPTAAPAPARAAGSRQHIVQSGDTLSKIAIRYYGDASKWDQIAEANRDIIANPDRLVVGASLRIP